ncbi:MAG: acyloxyacyl hydrolase [Desulfuromonas sp.]|mgnify:CR=1 FL=1|nr:MAG: acyloxyacyl hydrolase [Desulfuromonas sp.]
MRPGLICILCGALLVTLTPAMARAEADPGGESVSYRPNRYGVGLLAGKAYDPEHFGLVILQGQMLVDYDRIVWHRAPEELYLKFEANLGITTDGRDKGLAAVNMLALFYLDAPDARRWRPFLEAGIGLIYTEYRVEGQGLYLNFNPQAGAGVEFRRDNGQALSIALRLHHLSNGNLYKDNRGVNSAFLMLGYLF